MGRKSFESDDSLTLLSVENRRLRTADNVVHLGLSLPNGMDWRVAVDKGRLETLCQIAGIKKLRIKGDNGIDSDGDFGLQNLVPQTYAHLAVSWAADIRVNLEKLLEGVEDDPASIAQRLNDLISKTLRGMAVQTLLKNYSKRDALLLGAHLGLIASDPSLDSIFALILVINLLAFATHKLEKTVSPDDASDSRVSLFSPHGPEIDRFLIFMMVLYYKNLFVATADRSKD